MSQSISYLSAWVTSGRQTVDLGSLTADTYIMRAHCHVTEAFNSDGTDTIVVGSDANDDSIVTSVDVSTTGIKTLTIPAAGYNASAQQIKIKYANSGSEPSTGAALFIFETAKTPPSPV